MQYKFFHYRYNDLIKIGVVDEDDSHYSVSKDFFITDLANNPALIDRSMFTPKNVLNKSSLEFLTPIINPGKVICVGLNYEDHVKELNRETLKHPTFFSRFTSSFVAHLDHIPITSFSDKYDYEGELAIIIGKLAYRVEADKAEDFICGYSIFNDVTVRDYQARTSQWLLGKNFDKTGAFGPYLVPASNVPKNASNLKIVTKINNKIMQSANTSEMIFKPYKIVSILSQVMTLSPNDVIITGTPGGVAVSRTPRTYLKDGDICQIYIEHLGLLENKMKYVD
jgi:acylpyruvate hydrolase